MGYDYPARQGGVQGNPCVGIWDELTAICEELYRGAPSKTSFDLPDTLVEAEFCPLSGDLTGPWCAETYTGRPTAKGWFIQGTQPDGVCSLHEEPPITVTPHDPADPDRIPLLPDDLLPDTPPAESDSSRKSKRRSAGNAPAEDGEGPLPWLSRWFSRFSHR